MKARYVSLTPLVSWRRVERPVNWAHYFGRQAPLHVEIGFGNGEFLVRQASAHPERNYVGLELEWASVQRGLRRLHQASLSNVRLLQVDAEIAMQRLFRPLSLERIYALFPCPWPKARHVKHRLFSNGFLQLLNSRLAADAEVQMVTDHEPYAQWVMEQVPGSGFTAQRQPVSPRFSTKYERKWRAKGQDRFYEIALRKERAIAVPVREDITLKTHRIASFSPEAFHPTSKPGDVTVEFRDFLFDPNRQRGMLWVFAVEGSFCQDFWIEIVRGKHDWTIRPARGCSIIPTLSVQRALDLVRDAIVQETVNPLAASYEVS